MLKRWKGYPAGLFELTSSHASLTIIVSGAEAGRNLVISCGGPEHIRGPFRWPDSDISISVVRLDSDPIGVAVADESAGLLVTAETFGVREHVKKFHGARIPALAPALESRE